MKCTYILTYAEITHAPGIKAEWPSTSGTTIANIQLMYTTYQNDAVTAAKGFLPTATITPGFLGAYTASTFPHPLTTGTHSSIVATADGTLNTNTYVTYDDTIYGAGEIGIYDYNHWPIAGLASTGTVSDYVVNK